MYALTKFGEVPNDLDGEMRYARIVARLRQEGFIDETRVADDGNRKYSAFRGVVAFTLVAALVVVVSLHLFPVHWTPRIFSPLPPYELAMIIWGGFFLAGVHAHFARDPGRDRLTYLYNFGTAAPGVLDVVRLDIRSNTPCYELAYHFTGPQGGRCKGRMMIFDSDLSSRDMELLNDTTDVTVLYHPDCPALNVIRLDKGVAEFNLRASAPPANGGETKTEI